MLASKRITEDKFTGVWCNETVFSQDIRANFSTVRQLLISHFIDLNACNNMLQVHWKHSTMPKNDFDNSLSLSWVKYRIIQRRAEIWNGSNRVTCRFEQVKKIPYLQGLISHGCFVDNKHMWTIVPIFHLPTTEFLRVQKPNKTHWNLRNIVLVPTFSQTGSLPGRLVWPKLSYLNEFFILNSFTPRRSDGDYS